MKTYNGPNLPPDKQVLYEMADGLSYIHQQKLAHGNIKPNNILVSLEGRIKISDFGLISSCSACYPLCEVRSTPPWVAPEVFKRNYSHKILPESDVFSAGCVAFFFLSRDEQGGIHPFGDVNDPPQVQINICRNDSVNINSN